VIAGDNDATGGGDRNAPPPSHASDPATAGDYDSGEIEYLDDGSVSIPIIDEELVVYKRLVVRERVIVRKDAKSNTAASRWNSAASASNTRKRATRGLRSRG